MVAAAALGNVVEDRGEVGELRLRQCPEDLRELRELVVVALERKATQVADDEQRMRIHGVGVEKVVLHAADDAAEGGDVAAEHAIEIHAPELVRDACGRAQDLEEQPVVAGVLAEFLVDEPQALRDQADGARAHAAQARVLLQYQEQLEQSRRMAREGIVRDRLEALVALLEMAVERQDGSIAVGNELLAELLQKQLVEPGNLHRGAVIALHELLDGERVGRVLVAEHPSQPDLVVEQEPVLAPPAHDVQREAHSPQPGLGRFQLHELAGREEAGPCEVAERVDSQNGASPPSAIVWMSRSPPGPCLTFGSRL